MNWVAHQDGDTEELTDYALKKYVVHIPATPPPALPTTENNSNDVDAAAAAAAAAAETKTKTKKSSKSSPKDAAGLVNEDNTTPASVDDADTSPSDLTTFEVSISDDVPSPPSVYGASLLCFLRRKFKQHDQFGRPAEV